jgi:SAM-dependent methyltransferase
MKWYGEDLAYVHDVGHSDYALQSAPGILNIFKQHDIQTGLIVDLGCGSGLSAAELTKAGYRVFGVDISESMIAIARARVPDAEFRVESLFKANLPPCRAVISVGECLNYLFDVQNDAQNDVNNNYSQLMQLFHRIYSALAPGGVFIFDVAEPGQVTSESTSQGFSEGKDWVILVEKQEDRKQATLTRRIVIFRKIEEYYRRSDEVHHLRLYEAADVAERLRCVGFQVQIMRCYGQYNLPKAHAAFVAIKSGSTKSI